MPAQAVFFHYLRRFLWRACFVYHGRYQTVEELLAQFERLTVDDVMNQTGEFLDPARQSLVAYGPAQVPALKVLPWVDIQEC